MRAVDTNVLARFIMDDDPVQSPRARAAIMDGVHIPITVLLETAWLLRSRYRQSPQIIRRTLTSVIDLPGVSIEQPDLVQWALGRYEQGADIADMLHIVASRPADVFLSFENDMERDAGVDSPLRIAKP